MDVLRNFQRQCSLTAARWAEDYNQQGVAFQSAGTPANVVPVAENSDGENEDGGDYQAGSFEFALGLVWHGLCGTGGWPVSSILALVLSRNHNIYPPVRSSSLWTVVTCHGTILCVAGCAEQFRPQRIALNEQPHGGSRARRGKVPVG